MQLLLSINEAESKMKKTILFVILSMMTCLGVMAQDKGPAAIDTENFSVKVPKSWLIKEQKSGSISSVKLVPEVAPDQPTNFGYSIEFWAFASKSYTVEGIIEEALGQYGEGATKKMEDISFGSNTFQRTFFDEGHGTSQVLALPLKGNGAIRIAVRSYPLTDKDVKAILKSVKVNK